MKPEELKLIIEQAIEGKLDYLWLVIAIVSFIFSLFGSFFGAYMKRKGENVATKEDFQTLLGQLSEQVRTTEQIKADINSSQLATTEQIKSAISNDYWRFQEWNKTRRSKLEDLVNCVFELQQLVNDDTNKLREEFYSNSDAIFNRMPTQILQIEMISMLYFYEELHSESLDLLLSFQRLQGKIIEQFNLHRKFNSGQLTDINVLREADMPTEIAKLHRAFSANFNEFQKVARKTLNEIARI